MIGSKIVSQDILKNCNNIISIIDGHQIVRHNSIQFQLFDTGQRFSATSIQHSESKSPNRRIKFKHTSFHVIICNALSLKNLHFSKLNGVPSNTGESIDNNVGAGASAGVSGGDFLRGDGEPPLFVQFDAHIVFREEIVPLKPVLGHQWSDVGFLLQLLRLQGSPLFPDFHCGKPISLNLKQDRQKSPSINGG